MAQAISIPIKIHPRAFSAFGEDLITNDNVAMIELVKNSYDAYALTVNIEFGRDTDGTFYIKISDDGCGMTLDTIENAWATIATSYKEKKPFITRKFIHQNSDGSTSEIERTRAVSGNKGLGRFSAARLGYIMTITTKHKDDECIEAQFDWRTFEKVTSLEDCSIIVSYQRDNPFITNERKTGTTILITDLRTEWSEQSINDLILELSRLINPFEQVNDFSITVTSEYDVEPVKITASAFINQPVYRISGMTDNTGTVAWTYYHDSGKKKRRNDGSILWSFENYGELANAVFSSGPFSFEIRAWDLDAKSTELLSERFDIKKGIIRNSIAQYKGISIYRDNILVLPKSESSRDWLGLDARRISRVGARLSTSQIVGIINISNKNNPEIKDTTDREKLTDNTEYRQFTSVILAVINTLQNERNKDRIDETPKATLEDIIAPLSSKELVYDLERAVQFGASSQEILKRVHEYDEKNEAQIVKLNERLVYYGQTASLGSVAAVLMHEILTGMTSIKRFLNKAQNYNQVYDDRTKKYMEEAERSHKRILKVTDSFTPLYRRDLRKKTNYSDLFDCVHNSVRLIQSKKISKGINFVYNIERGITVQMNEGELQTVFINLFDNACYWITESKTTEKRIVIKTESLLDDRLTVSVSDSGVGVHPDEAEKIFTPGITSKPNGIGMGLVIVTELISAYNGKVGVRFPSDLQGATFVFDIPIKRG